MRRLLKICLVGAVAVLGGLVARRLLGLEEEMQSPGPAASTPRPATTASSTDVTRDELYQEAKDLQVEGRSKMNKGQLQDAVEAAKTGGSA